MRKRPVNRAKKGAPRRWLEEHLNYTGDDCLKWPFSTKSSGYGQIGTGEKRGRPTYAHRVMCQMVHGDPPTSLHEAAHECGNGRYGCCNPRHIRWLTHHENLAERVTPSGEDAWSAKLTKAEAIAVVALRGKLTQEKIGELFGISGSTVSHIQRGEAWKSLL
ncbi:HNH endonuclease [Mesorhizobium caraganae]|uniref:HNH endonuclease n=1 Tax=Mesorhizobium caraganae TaxID=483206 RepID=UPI0017870771